ncbi:hypothetical protein PVAP13_1KG157010 [Panicum virgatum]|uniref:Uncharacterized protein n=1 Tax=Panicum virgatum TaxID=38727 RepID=A0A8T0XFT8_PANVG|nr:hypothetical protein PVAP13_1KG157010 [Panicum virgatum]KAG2657720.1 hypothetical protein PVAP13_1KG157010 [Panicum virgatum]
MSVKSRRKAIASQLFHTRASHRPQGRAGARLRFPAAPVPFLRTPTAPKRFLLLPARDPFPQPAPAQIHFPTPLLSSSGTGAAQPQLMLLPSPIWSLAPPVTADPFPTPHLIPTQHLLPSPLPSSDGDPSSQRHSTRPSSRRRHPQEILLWPTDEILPWPTFRSWRN